MQQDMKITVFEMVEWIYDFALSTTLLVQELQLFSSFSRGGGTPPKIFNNFLFIDFLQSAKSSKYYISFCFLVSIKNYFI